MCQNPIAIKARVIPGSLGSTTGAGINLQNGFWCFNQPDDICADFEVKYFIAAYIIKKNRLPIIGSLGNLVSYLVDDG